MIYRKFIVGFTAAVAIMVGVDLLSYRSAENFITASGERQKHYKTFEQLESILSKMKDAEMGERGYVITGKINYLVPYHGAVMTVDRTLSELRDLTKSKRSNENAQEWVKQVALLEALVGKHFSELGKTVELRQQKGFEEALKEVLTGKSDHALNDIRKLVGEMKQDEEKVIQQHDQQVEENYRVTLFFFFSGNVIGYAILGLVFFRLAREVAERKRVQEAREKLVRELQDAMAKIKTLSGLLPICAQCKKIRNDKGYWVQVESYFREHSDVEFSHGICPECMKKYYSDLE